MSKLESIVDKSRARRTFLREAASVIAVLALSSGGCQTTPGVYTGLAVPRIRWGSCWGLVGVRYLGFEDLGIHKKTERNGMVGTRKGGFVDIAHVRNTIDLTKYFKESLEQEICNNGNELSFKLTDPSIYYITIVYPENWQIMNPIEKASITNDISVKVGEYIAYNAAIWHEVVTWFGRKAAGIFPMFISAFSPEDNYSNALGARIGALALRDTTRTFNNAVTYILNNELASLLIRPKGVVKKAAKAIKGIWYIGTYPFSDMKKRHLEPGIADGYVTPWPLPDYSQQELQTCPVPSTSCLTEHGFLIKFEIMPPYQQKKIILDIVYPSTRGKIIEPAIHYAEIMQYIRKDAIQRYGHNVDRPYLPSNPP